MSAHIPMSDALKHALIALSFFRSRNQRAPRFAHATRRHNQEQTVSRRAERVKAARAHIRLARQHGWRGSITAAIAKATGAAT